jgi:signal transduction histidine kinase
MAAAPIPDVPPAAAPSEPAERIRALEAALAEKGRQIDALQEEIEETNRGVVALYAELDTQAEALRKATELKSRFLAYMSHEFRTPISSIRSLSRLLLDHTDGPLSAEQETQVRFIESTAEEFAEMVDDLLDLAKVEAGRVDISAQWFEMVDLFSTLRGMFRGVLTRPEVVLVFEEPRQAMRLYTDHKKLSQILRNFISNALKFTVKGEVRVAAVTNDDETITFSVKDTGIGIARELQGAIFRDFTQIDSPIQKRLRGTGLGLSLSKSLAELLGGRVGLESELGRGANFYVTVPLHLPERPPTDGAAGIVASPPPASGIDGE